MNRRNFLTMSVLAPLARLPEIEAAADLPALLRPFVLTYGGNDYRAPLREVFRIDGWQVATDGRVCVRGRDRWARRKDDKPPFAENLNWEGPWGPGFRIAEFPHEGKYLRCEVCQRTGPQPMGDGDWWCGFCENEGMENHRCGELPEEFGGLRLRMRYVQRIMQLPEVVWHTNPDSVHGFAVVGWDMPDGPVRFTWRHGDGLLMPMVKQLERAPDVQLGAQWTAGDGREDK